MPLHRRAAAGRWASQALPAHRPVRGASSPAAASSSAPDSGARAATAHSRRIAAARPAAIAACLLAGRRIHLRQFPEQHAHRPAVGNNVMNHHHQHLASGASLNTTTRSSGPVDRSNGADASAYALASSLSFTCAKSTGRPTASAMSWKGSPSAARKRVRRLSCRAPDHSPPPAAPRDRARRAGAVTRPGDRHCCRVATGRETTIVAA